MDWLTTLDWARITTVLVDNRVFLEVVGLVFGSALIGFIAARWLYRGQVDSRSEIMRREFTLWRRRTSQGGSRLQRANRDRDYAARKLRQSRTA